MMLLKMFKGTKRKGGRESWIVSEEENSIFYRLITMLKNAHRAKVSWKLYPASIAF